MIEKCYDKESESLKIGKRYSNWAGYGYKNTSANVRKKFFQLVDCQSLRTILACNR